MSLDATVWAWKVRNIRPSEKLVLLSMADRAGENNTCFPSIERLHNDTQLDRKTIISAIAALIDKGLIEDTGDRSGITKSTKHYRLIGVKNRHDNSFDSSPNNGTSLHESSPKNGTSSSSVFPISSTKNGTSSSTKNGTSSSPKNGTQNLSIESTNRTYQESTNATSKTCSSENKNKTLIDAVAVWYQQQGYTEKIQQHLDDFITKISTFANIPRDLPGLFRKAIEQDWAGLRRAPDPEWAQLPEKDCDLVAFIVKHGFPNRLRHVDTIEICRRELKKLIAERLVEHRLNTQAA